MQSDISSFQFVFLFKAISETVITMLMRFELFFHFGIIFFHSLGNLPAIFTIHIKSINKMLLLSV